MTSQNINFTGYSGRAVWPIFTLTDNSGNPINLTQFTDILWNAQRSLQDEQVLAKTYLTGGIVYVTDGSDGKFQVKIGDADTTDLSGYYMHQAWTLDALGNQTEIVTGRWQVARSPAWSYSGDPALSDKDAVRFYIGDTDPANPLLFDGEILFTLTKFPSALFAAAQCARTLVSKFTKQVLEKGVGDLRLKWSDQVKNYTQLAKDLQTQAEQDGVNLFAGGACASDHQPFSIYQFDIPGACGPAIPPCGVCGGPSDGGCGCGG